MPERHPLRVTPVVRAVMTTILEASPQAWGYLICERTGYRPGSVYPALERMEKAGWIVAHWEAPAPAPAGRPRRRLYDAAYVAWWYRDRLAS